MISVEHYQLLHFFLFTVLNLLYPAKFGNCDILRIYYQFIAIHQKPFTHFRQIWYQTSKLHALFI